MPNRGVGRTSRHKPKIEVDFSTIQSRKPVLTGKRMEDMYGVHHLPRITSELQEITGPQAFPSFLGPDSKSLNAGTDIDRLKTLTRLGI